MALPTLKFIGGLQPVEGNAGVTTDSTQRVVIASDQASTLASATKQEELKTLTGAVTETAPVTDTASSGLNGRLQRIAQRLTSLMGLIGEVQGSPTSNTLLGRLKDIYTALTGTLTVNTGLSQPLTDTQLRANPISVTEGLSIPTYDHMSLSYSGSNLSQVIYKVGGVNGTTVATLNLSYDLNNNVTSITKV